MIRSFIDQLGVSGINLIDIGSSGSLDLKWLPIQRLINLVGFDPNVEECRRQNSLPSKYRSSTFLPYAVHGENGEETLYKTKSIYCYSLLKPNKEWLDRFAFHELFDLDAEETISVRAIDQIKELDRFQPDAIKIDVQGLELPILRKATALLDSAFYVETETGFTPNYHGETTFSELDRFMQENSFLMFDINTNHRIPRNNRLKDFPTGGEQILWAEAVWLKDYVSLEQSGKLDALSLNALKVKKILILCALQRCYDFGLELAELFHSKGWISAFELQALGDVDAWDLAGRNGEAENGALSTGSAVPLLARLFRLLPQRLRNVIHKASA